MLKRSISPGIIVRLLAISSFLGSGSIAQAASSVNKQCPSSNICYSINIPDSTASSGTGDVYIQITGPSSHAWIGIGTGSSMSGSNIFVIYTSSNGGDITLSTRKGKGHAVPSYSNDIQAKLLEGSGVSNGMITANIKCLNCSPLQSNWIFAAKQGSSLNSDSQSASLQQHQNIYGSFSFDLARAKGGSSSNPFDSNTAGSSGSLGKVCAGTASSSGPESSSSSGTGSGTSLGPSSGSSPPSNGDRPPFGFFPWGGYHPGGPPSGPPPGSPQYPPFFGPPGDQASSQRHRPYPAGSPSGPPSKRAVVNPCQDNLGGFNQDRSSGSNANRLSKGQIKVVAHGALAGLCFAGLFPLGAIAIRLLSFPALVWIHAVFQIFTQILFIIAFALGITISRDLNYMDQPHSVIGILVFVLLFLQLALGFIHHNSFKSLNRRTIWSYSHIWLGRVIITLGIINGGLGFLLARNSGSGPKVYGIIAGIMWLLYLISIVIGERRRTSTKALN